MYLNQSELEKILQLGSRFQESFKFTRYDFITNSYYFEIPYSKRSMKFLFQEKFRFGINPENAAIEYNFQSLKVTLKRCPHETNKVWQEVEDLLVRYFHWKGGLI